jgi:hypothetical protein
MNRNTPPNRSLADRLQELQRQIRETDKQWQRTRAALSQAGDVQFVVESMPEPVNPVAEPPKGLRA